MIFVTDHIFLRCNGIIYSNKFSIAVFKRYTKIFGKMVVAGRVKEVESTCGVDRCSNCEVTFYFFDSLSRVKNLVGRRKKVRASLRKLLAKHEYLIARIPSQLGFLAMDLAKQEGLRACVEVVGCGWEANWNNGRLLAKVYSFYSLWKMRRVVASSEYSIFVTKEKLQKRYPPKRGAITTYASNVELTETSPKVLAFRKAKISSMEEKNLITFGTIGSLETTLKGIDLAIRALGECRFDFEYRVLGSGKFLGVYRRLASKLGVGDQVVFDGELAKKKDVEDWLDKLDIYLQPSVTEGLPRALIEAMSRGCPCIGSNAGGIPELLNSQVTFKKGSYRGLKLHLERLVSDKNELRGLALENFQNSREFEKTKIELRRDEVFLRLMDGKPKH
jgi:glycosyltransferase involved in cell wall biosynthesis